MYGNRRYQTFADFERELIKPTLRAGWTVDELEESGIDDLDFDLDPFESALQAVESGERV
jgi:hypothetical protein